MRTGTVIGRVVCTLMHPAFRGDTFVLVLPWNTKTWNAGGKSDFDASLVAYDELGVADGQVVAFAESGDHTFAAYLFKLLIYLGDIVVLHHVYFDDAVEFAGLFKRNLHIVL